MNRIRTFICLKQSMRALLIERKETPFLEILMVWQNSLQITTIERIFTDLMIISRVKEGLFRTLNSRWTRDRFLTWRRWGNLNTSHTSKIWLESSDPPDSCLMTNSPLVKFKIQSPGLTLESTPEDPYPAWRTNTKTITVGPKPEWAKTAPLASILSAGTKRRRQSEVGSSKRFKTLSLKRKDKTSRKNSILCVRGLINHLKGSD